jgi:hypothetical protein
METRTLVERAWKHLELAKLCLGARDLDIALWHLDSAARTACGRQNLELLDAVRKVRNGMGPWTSVHPDALHIDRLLAATTQLQWTQENPQQDNRNGQSR